MSEPEANAWFRGFCCVAGLGLAASGAALATGFSLDVKPGLWELQTSGQASGVPLIPPEALANLKPEQRLIAEATLLAIVAQANQPHLMQFCVTPEQLRQGLDLNRIGWKGCRRTVKSSSPMGLDMQMDCSGHDPMSGVVHLRVVDHATVAGDIDVQAGTGANGLSIRQNLHGKWLGAACGEVQSFD